MNMPLVLLNRRRRGGAAAFTPAGLFALAEPGVWYDPSDLTTLFQDTAGTTPVTTPGQTVALALDKSKGLVLGSELVSNPGPFTGTTGWTSGRGASSITAVSGLLRNAATGSTASDVQFTFTGLVVGKTYRLVGSFALGTSPSYRLRISTVTGLSGGNVLDVLYTGDATYNGVFVATAATMYGGILGNFTAGSQYCDVVSFSVKELPGFHATQATLASRPTYGIVPLGGRRNLLTYSEDLTNAVWTTIGGTTKNSALNFTFTATTSRIYQSFSLISGSTYTLSVRFSDADVGKKIRPTFFDSSSGWSLLADTTIPVGGVVTRTFTMANAGTFVGFQAASDLSANTSFTLVSGRAVQLETGSSATAYQRVGSAFDVTEAGVASLSYLSFDGVDDGLVTPTITPGIDKAQVFAGVRKLSDAAAGAIVGHSSNPAGSTGALEILGPAGTGSNDYRWTSRGTVTATQTASGFAAPTTDVLSGIFDISGDRVLGRVDGVQQFDLIQDQGTGNYLAYPIYVGRRGGASIPFNGNLFSLIVRFGTNLDAATITNTETWVNSKTGAYT